MQQPAADRRRKVVAVRARQGQCPRPHLRQPAVQPVVVQIAGVGGAVVVVAHRQGQPAPVQIGQSQILPAAQSPQRDRPNAAVHHQISPLVAVVQRAVCQRQRGRHPQQSVGDGRRAVKRVPVNSHVNCAVVARPAVHHQIVGPGVARRGDQPVQSERGPAGRVYEGRPRDGPVCRPDADGRINDHLIALIRLAVAQQVAAVQVDAGGLIHIPLIRNAQHASADNGATGVGVHHIVRQCQRAVAGLCQIPAVADHAIQRQIVPTAVNRGGHSRRNVNVVVQANRHARLKRAVARKTHVPGRQRRAAAHPQYAAV